MNKTGEIISRLSDSGKDVSWYGKASDDSIRKVEEHLGVKLPSSLKSFLTTIGGGGVVGEEISGIEDDIPSLPNKGTILGDTERCRIEYGLPPTLAVVYFTDDGVSWCVDCAGQNRTGESPVVSYSNFTRKIDADIAPTFTEFLNEYVNLRVSR